MVNCSWTEAVRTTVRYQVAADLMPYMISFKKKNQTNCFSCAATCPPPCGNPPPPLPQRCCQAGANPAPPAPVGNPACHLSCRAALEANTPKRFGQRRREARTGECKTPGGGAGTCERTGELDQAKRLHFLHRQAK